ncbi:hypothetical protein AZI85_17110 [Bdellovibrio bacteriovorus]|uniref:Na+/H+ antiporter subunit E n=1 Tax=Bdellovibrio bacteriovorus TaxID=959 RepID=A0A150WTE1_BDEBC|nr:Na+/H+ antiporter subunit E [Bdellovibrio bacteriovorus]KYG67599.1 hypothetical protein AZI85_17110 [Bdellovibrio bacteriovorus]
MMRKLKLIIEIFFLFLHDFFIAVFEVASALFHPNEDLHPVIVRMPTRLKNKKALWLFSLIISLTPGSLVVDLSKDESILYIHFFHAPDTEKAMTALRVRFEARLFEIFSQGDRV